MKLTLIALVMLTMIISCSVHTKRETKAFLGYPTISKDKSLERVKEILYEKDSSTIKQDVGAQELDEASYYLGILLNDEPKNVSGLNYRGIVNKLQGKNDEALSDFKAASDLSPQNVSIKFNLANMYFDVEKYNEAITVYNSILKERELQPSLHLNLAKSYEFLGNNEEALEHYLIVRELEPENKLANLKSEKLKRYFKFISMIEEAKSAFLTCFTKIDKEDVFLLFELKVEEGGSPGASVSINNFDGPDEKKCVDKKFAQLKFDDFSKVELKINYKLIIPKNIEEE